MKLEDVVALAKSGYTSTQISALMNLATSVTPVAPVTPVTPVTPVQPVLQVQQTSPVPTLPIVNSQGLSNESIMAEIQRLTIAMQGSNIANSNLPTPENTDDILAQIINPKEVSK